MATKVVAAKIAVGAGCSLCIAAGREAHPLRRIESGARCTWFVAEASPVTVRKQWIAGMLQPAGEITVDEGAVRALRDGKSLLPAGITQVKGRFDRGDAVLVRDPAGVEIARALRHTRAAMPERIRGRRSSEVEQLLGYEAATR